MFSTHSPPSKTTQMRLSKAQTTARVHAFPTLRFEHQRLTAFSGLVLIQALLQRLRLKERLGQCQGPDGERGSYGFGLLMLLLVVHLLLGFRNLRDRDLYAKDPLVLRTLGLRCLPDVSTLSRRLASATPAQGAAVQRLLRAVVLDRLEQERLARVTVDLDGSVLSTRRHAEGSAVGYNRKRKGERSYYPLLATVAQTGQFLDVLHRPGNVHDSKGAQAFATECIRAVRSRLPRAQVEVRMDSAFFSESMVQALDQARVEFAVSVPFERFPQLKQVLAQQQDWRTIDDQWAYAETNWQPQSWQQRSFRFVLLRCRRKVQQKGPLQLDLFKPTDLVYEYKVLVTNKACDGATALFFHNGRGSQEALIGEAKDACGLGYVPSRRRIANQLFCTAALLAHNLGRELQMAATPRASVSEPQRPALWPFQTLRHLRDRLLLRPGRLTQPKGVLTLTASLEPKAQALLQHYLAAQTVAA